MAEEPKHQTGMTIVTYENEDSEEGEVIWDGEAESLGLPHAKTMPRVVSVDPASDEDEAEPPAPEPAQPEG